MTKKRAVFTIITCSIAVVLLSCVLMVGLSDDGFAVLRTPSGIETPFGNDYVVELDPAEDHLDVKELEINWEAGPVRVETTRGSKIRITETSSRKLEENEQMQVRAGSDGKLEIDWDHSRFRLFSFSFFGDNSKSLVVELPQEMAARLTEIDCSNISGDMEISSLTGTEGNFSSVSGALHLTDLTCSEDCSLSTTSGDIVLENCRAETMNASTTSGALFFDGITTQEISCNTVSGEVYVGGSTETFNSSTVSGVCHAAFTACPEEVDMDSVSGQLTVELPPTACFTVDYSTISGEFSCDFPSPGRRDNERTYGNGRATGEFTFSTTSGDIQVCQK